MKDVKALLFILLQLILQAEVMVYLLYLVKVSLDYNKREETVDRVVVMIV